MKFPLFLRATVAVLAFASQVFANPVPASSGSANPWPPDPWPAKPVLAPEEPWPPRVVYYKRPRFWRHRSPLRMTETRVDLALQARSSVSGMGEMVSTGAAGFFGLGFQDMQDPERRRICRTIDGPGPAVPTVGKPLADIEDCVMLAEKLRRRAPFYINYNEFPHSKHRTLVKYKSCSLGVQMADWTETLAADINIFALVTPKAVLMTNQELLDFLFETMANVGVDGKVGMMGDISCPDWVTVYNPQREEYRPRWFNVHWDVYSDHWDEATHT